MLQTELNKSENIVTLNNGDTLRQKHPADGPSRALHAQESIFKSQWIKGPEFMWNPEFNPKAEESPVIPLSPDDAEI